MLNSVSILVFTAVCKDNDTHGILMNKEIRGLKEISSISAHCHASVAPQGAKTNIKVYRSIYMHHNSIIISLNV